MKLFVYVDVNADEEQLAEREQKAKAAIPGLFSAARLVTFIRNNVRNGPDACNAELHHSSDSMTLDKPTATRHIICAEENSFCLPIVNKFCYLSVTTRDTLHCTDSSS